MTSTHVVYNGLSFCHVQITITLPALLHSGMLLVHKH